MSCQPVVIAPRTVPAVVVTDARPRVMPQPAPASAVVVQRRFQSVIARQAERAVIHQAGPQQRTVTHGVPGAAGADGDRLIQDNFVVDASALADRAVPLSDAPADPSKVELIVYGGPEQRPGVDFAVSGNELWWSGLALELLLEQGDAFSVRYMAS